MRILLILALLTLSACSRTEFYRRWNGKQPMPTERERTRYVQSKIDLPLNLRDKIIMGHVSVGMTEDDVIAVMGKSCGSYDLGDGYSRWDYNYDENGFMQTYSCYDGKQTVYFTKGKVAFVNKSEYLEFLRKQEGKAKEAQIQKKRDYIKKNGIDKVKADNILKGMVSIGMTTEDVEVSWGKPKDINRSVGAWGVHEQWVYGSSNYLYFENGKLTSWQD